jgi:general secretion pathway protein H
LIIKPRVSLLKKSEKHLNPSFRRKPESSLLLSLFFLISWTPAFAGVTKRFLTNGYRSLSLHAGSGRKYKPSTSLNHRGSAGFTLIEVAVVMLVIVIVLGIVSVNLEPDRETPVRDEARRMVLLLQTAQQESILQGRVFAVAVERQGYYFLALNENREFKPVEGDEVLRARPLPADIVISRVDVEGVPEDDETKIPRLILLPTGELSPFTVVFSRGDVRWRVEGTLTGEITAQTAAPAEKT